MDEKNIGSEKELSEEELKQTVGGVGVDEMKSLAPGTRLIYSEFLKGDMCELEYLGRYIDPGFGYYYQLRCLVTKILVEGRDKIAIFGRYVHEPLNGTSPLYIKEGLEVWVARNDVRVV